MTKILRIAATALVISAVAVPAIAAEKAATATDDPVAARIDGQVIYRSEIVRELQAMGSQAMQIPTSVLYPQLLEKAIITKLVSKKGYDQKLQNDKEVTDRLKMAENQIVADVYVHRTIQPKITDEKIKARYDKLVAKYKPEDEVRARHILVPTEAEANDILKQLKDGADFAKLATEKSKDTGSSKQGGDLGYFVKESMVKPFADAAFSMKAGEVSEKPVKSDFGYHIIKVEDRRKSSPPPLADVKDQIMNQVGQEMVQDLIKDMVSKAKIERFAPDGSPMKAPSDKVEQKETKKK